ncbi:hypothetical protein H4K36_28315 [Streptomyces sp. DHE7-1]|nr:hypothetical protein [Streptomyces sp. DHE7-1]
MGVRGRRTAAPGLAAGLPGGWTRLLHEEGYAPVTALGADDPALGQTVLVAESDGVVLTSDPAPAPPPRPRPAPPGRGPPRLRPPSRPALPPAAPTAWGSGCGNSSSAS